MTPNPEPYVRPGDELSEFLRRFWQRQVATAERETPDFRHPALPLARIKKVMKSDPEVKVMIAADAPILFCKACEMFIAEMTARAFLVADSNKRRTLSRADIAKALSKSDQFDFLIDIVPRDEPFGTGPSARARAAAERERGKAEHKRERLVDEQYALPPGQNNHASNGHLAADGDDVDLEEDYAEGSGNVEAGLMLQDVS
ncbi:histone-fold-containing protein [Sistotremastrum suecicum HHB10207 ss-3]|uniref:Histone-fold-containing protein n=1 Tax=Sistotremastrum suecicum HHB10207 ss-3 TaxID=1314776 RepID=A0A166C5B2_9AGAM|nr:histone-fold-containing protein [Sistotremastrum suecicum HHB10207 ss-3]